MFKPVLRDNGVNPDEYSDEYIARVVGLVKGRINFVRDLWEQAAFFFKTPESYDPKAVKKRWSAETPAIMTELIDRLNALDDFSSQAAEQPILDWITAKGYHMGNVMNAFRLAVVGECKGPHMFDITELLGREESIRRIQLAIERLKTDEPAV